MIEIVYACADRCVRFPADLTKLAKQTGSGSTPGETTAPSGGGEGGGESPQSSAPPAKTDN